MYSGKFVDLSKKERELFINEKFKYDTASNAWYTAKGEFAGSSVEDVVEALIDLEDAEINSIGDCMTGFCVTPPKLSDFVRNKK